MPEDETVTPEPAAKRTRAVPVEKKPDLPAKIKMLAPFGFMDVDGSHRYWFQSMIVDMPQQIEMIVSHGFSNYEVL